ncbi:hypothetical protein [Mycolicibacterium flavescens]|uniref:Uncharacterized protein n=1 Tax=Mycolicibacterium flavescens TaxID=1776 RepID=A0A1E3R7N8_MYCFV|nr:hypothetical protein BHQ18_28140 [Mycolicibacterium flavescens]
MEREIESWLGELRGTSAPPPPENRGQRPPRAQRPAPADTGNEATTAIPTPSQDPDATTAIPTPPKDVEAATEKLNTREDDDRQRRGGGVSAQDLLRREGRL